MGGIMTIKEFIDTYDKSVIENANVTIVGTDGKHIYYGKLSEVPYNLLSGKIIKWRAYGFARGGVDFTLYITTK